MAVVIVIAWITVAYVVIRVGCDWLGKWIYHQVSKASNTEHTLAGHIRLGL